MKANVPDQAEKLRQLAAQEEAAVNAVDLGSEQATAVADPPEEESSSRPAPPEPRLPRKSKRARKTGVAPAPITDSPQNKTKTQPAPQQSQIVSQKTKLSEPNDPRKTIQLSKRFLAEAHTRVIAISGGKGGVGKSNVACNLGIAMAMMGKRVLLMDADLSLANVDVLMGLTPRLNLSHVISGEKRLEEILVNGPENLRLLPGGSGVEELSQLSQETIDRLFNDFSQLTPAPDVMIIDTAAGIHPNVIQFLLAADQAVVVTTPEPTAYTDAYALIKTIVRHDSKKEIGVLVNMAKDGREANEVTRLLLQICKQMLNITFNNLGYIPRDPEAPKAVRHQKPLLLKAPNAPASRAIRQLASILLQIPNPKSARQGLSGFFRRLMGRSAPPPTAANSG